MVWDTSPLSDLPTYTISKAHIERQKVTPQKQFLPLKNRNLTLRSKFKVIEHYSLHMIHLLMVIYHIVLNIKNLHWKTKKLQSRHDFVTEKQEFDLEVKVQVSKAAIHGKIHIAFKCSTFMQNIKSLHQKT